MAKEKDSAPAASSKANAPRKTPWLPLWASDWNGSPAVRRMGLAARGLYLTMLLHQWEYGSVPDDPAEVARLACLREDEVRANWAEVLACFVTRNGALVNAKLCKLKRAAEGGNLHRRGRQGRSDARSDAGSDAGSDAEKDAPQILRYSEEADTPESAPTERTARRRAKPRLDGKAELDAAYAELSEQARSPELWEACDEYRRERQTARFPVWPRQKWARVFEDARGDAVCAAAALRTATQGPNRSVHPKPTQRNTGAPGASPAAGAWEAVQDFLTQMREGKRPSTVRWKLANPEAARALEAVGGLDRAVHAYRSSAKDVSILRSQFLKAYAEPQREVRDA